MAEGGAWVRLTVLRANDLNKQIKNILGRKAEIITKNKELRKYINSMYKEIVMPFVPLSNETKMHHLKDAYVTDDGRIIWTATRSTKEGTSYNYADIQYRPEEHGVVYQHYTTPGTGPHWTDKVQPGTDEWEVLVEAVTPEIIRVYDNG